MDFSPVHNRPAASARTIVVTSHLRILDFQIKPYIPRRFPHLESVRRPGRAQPPAAPVAGGANPSTGPARPEAVGAAHGQRRSPARVIHARTARAPRGRA